MQISDIARVKAGCAVSERNLGESTRDKLAAAASTMQIKEACPDVVFHVHHMTDPKADPFLIAQLGRELYYVEVWAEPRFEQQF